MRFKSFGSSDQKTTKGVEDVTKTIPLFNIDLLYTVVLLCLSVTCLQILVGWSLICFVFSLSFNKLFTTHSPLF